VLKFLQSVAKFDEAKHPRHPGGTSEGGEFAASAGPYYHGTSNEIAAKILKDGLLPLSDMDFSSGITRGKGFAATSEKVAISYAGMASDDSVDTITVIVFKPEASKYFKPAQKHAFGPPGSWPHARGTEMSSTETVPPSLVQEVRQYKLSDVLAALGPNKGKQYADWETPLEDELEPVSVVRKSQTIYVAILTKSGDQKWDASQHPRDPKGEFTDKAAATLDAVDDLPVSPEIQELEEAWVGGVADFGDARAAEAIQNVEGYEEYRQSIADTLRKHLGDSITAYRSMSPNEYEDWTQGGGPQGLVGVTLDPEVAKHWEKFALNTEPRTVASFQIDPAHVVMRGSRNESEIVVDADWIEQKQLRAVKWDESQHPRDLTGKFTYTPQHEAPEKGEWDYTGVDPNAMVGPGPKWVQQHRELVREALYSWLGDPAAMRIHASDALTGAYTPGSGSGKQMRAQAEALLWELQYNSKPIPMSLYRGSGAKGDRPGNPFSWSEDRAIAKAFAKRYGGTVQVLPAGTARGLRVRDYVGGMIEEKQWIVRAGNNPLTKKYDPSEPRDDKGRWTKDGGQFTTFYHGTLQEQLDSIKAHGLKTDYSGLAWPGLSQPGTIYLARTKHDATVWAESSAIRLQWKYDNPVAVVLEIRVPKEVLAKSQRTTGIIHTGEPEGNLRVFQDIPPEWIRSVTVGRSYDVIQGRPDRPPRTPSPVVIPPFIQKQESTTFYVGLVMEGARVQKQEHDYGNTHIMIDPWSAAASSLNTARNLIRDEDRMGVGKDVDPNHITVRYGLLNEDLDTLRTFIAHQQAFEAQVIGIELFPPSEYSEGAVPVVARISSPELHAVEAEIGKYADFKEKSFPEYKPHCTLAYVSPDAAPQYANLPVYGNCLVHSITISHASGVQETIPFGMTKKWDEILHPRDQEGKFTEREAFVQAAIQRGEAHLVSEKEFLSYHFTGQVPSDAYEKYEAGDMNFIHRKDFDTLLSTHQVGDETVELRVQAEPARYPKQTVAASDEERNRLYEEYEQAAKRLGTDPMSAGIDLGRDSEAYKSLKVHEQRWLRSGSDYVRDEHGDLVYLTPEEMKAKGLSPTTYTVGAFVGDKAVGYAGDEFGASGVYMARGYQHHGLGLALLKTYLEKSGRLAKGRQIGQMTNAGENVVRALHRQLVKEAASKVQKRQGKLWDESKHPRHPGGSSQGGEFESAPRDALQSILNGERASIDPGDLRKFMEMARDQPEDPNLLHLHVDGFKVFDQTGLGIKREDMPQIPREHRENFLKEMKAAGVMVEKQWVDPLSLAPSQDEISARNAGEKLLKYETKDKEFPPLLVSQEGRVLDGHHHWAMMAALAIDAPHVKVPIYRLNVHVRQALAMMKAYDRKYHIKPKSLTTKADPVSGRYVTPFVSFDKQGDDQLRMIASLNSSRLATWGFTAEAEVRGFARYRITAVLDGRTSEFCRFIDGKIFDVTDGREKVIEALNVQNPDDLRTVQPWPKQTKAAMADFREMSNDDLVERGLQIPPYHPYCRTLLRPVTSSGDELDAEDIVPTIPEDVETFQPVTLADLQELGIDATQEDVDQWNAHVGMSPVELLSKLSGMEPRDVLTDGVGSNPVGFDQDGNIAFNSRGEVNGVEFKLGALLDPFTGIYYLTQADLATGTPSAEAAFLKKMFSALIDMGESSPTATAIAVGVAGNAAYYAKLGFLPDEIEWDTIRQFALDELETSLQPMLESLAPEDQELVRHLLQDSSVGALSALVDLPFEYEGKTIGEWILEETSGTWELDLTDDAIIEQAKAYLS
jgi:2'-5' RNA ligase